MRHKILVIEDDLKILRTLSLYLEEAGFSLPPKFFGRMAAFPEGVSAQRR